MNHRIQRALARATVAALAVAALIGGTVTPAAADDGATVIGTVDGTEFRLAEIAGGGYALEASRGGSVLWRTTAGAVSARLQGVAAAVWAHYASVEATAAGVVAVAELGTPAGSVLRVVDSYAIGTDALEVHRDFAVTSLAAADQGRGIALQFAIRDTAAREPQSYQWFAPGAWYGNGADTFSDRTKLAFDGVETATPVDALGAPLFAAFDPQNGIGLTLADRTDGARETVASDQFPQNAKTIVDARLNLPGLGLRKVTADGSHSELVQSYPGWNINFRNRYSGKPVVARYLPLDAQLTGDTAFALRLRGYDDYADALRTIWRAAYADDAKIARRFDTKVHFDTLVDYVDASYGLDQGRRAYYTNYALHLPYSGFLWRNADTAWVMLAQGWNRQDAGMRERARNVIADQLSQGGLVTSNPRTAAESHLNLMRAYLEDRAHGVENPSWLAEVRSYADGLPAAAPYYAAEVLLMLARFTGEEGYRTKAKAGAEAAWQDGQKDFRFRGALEDYAGGPAELDREAGYIALTAFLALYDDASDPAERARWLGYARTAADYCETWTFVQDIQLVPYDADPSLLMYGNEDVPAYGITGIHLGAAGGDAYEAMHAIDFSRLADATGDEHYRDFAVYIEKNSILYTNLGDKAGLMADSTKNTGLGFGNEYLGTSANDYWNNNQRGDGNASNIGWLTYGLLAMTQRTIDATAGYTLDGSTVTTINGLNAYYQLVNKATGEVLDVADDSRLDGAAVVTTGRDAGADRTRQWLFQPTGDGSMKLVNRSTAKVLTVPGADPTPGAGLTQAVFYPDLAYRFSLADAGDGWVTITSASTSRLVEATPTAEADGHRVQQNVATGSDFQRWRLVPVGDLQLLDATQPLALTSAGGAAVPTAFDDDATLAQRWVARDADEGYLGLVDRSTGLALTVRDGSWVLEQPEGADFGGFGFAQQFRLTLGGDGNVTLTSRADAAASRVIRLQTAGPATVDTPVSIVGADTVQRTVEHGQAATPPATVPVSLSDGTASTSPVTWPALPTAPGRHELRGSLPGTQLQALLVLAVLPAGGIASIDPIAVSTTAGSAPVLPATVTGRGGGAAVELPVVWDAIDPAQYASVGEFTVRGTVDGVAVRAEAVVTVTPAPTRTVVSIDPVRVRTVPGTAPALPAEVLAHFDDGSSETVPVAWDAIDPSAYASAGYLAVPGTGGGGDVTAHVTVAWFVDTFTQADGPTSWATGGAATWRVTDGALLVPVMGSGASSYAMARSGGQPVTTSGDFVYEADVTLRQVGNGGLFFRAPGGDDRNGYYFGLEGHTQQFVVGKQVNNAWNEFRYAPAGAATGVTHHLRAVVRGSTISYYVDDMVTPLYTATDTQFTVGSIGVRSWQSAMTVDNVVLRPIPALLAPEPIADVHTRVGTAPTLPGTVRIVDAAGDTRGASVTWNAIPSSAYQSAGSFEVQGTAAGLPVRVTVVVDPAARITSIDRPLVLTAPGTAPQLPATVVAHYDDASSTAVPVTWDALAPGDYAAPGYVEAHGHLTGAPDMAVTAAVGVAVFAADFADGSAAGWTPYGGNWTVDAQKRYGVTISGWSGLGEKSVASAAPRADLVYQGTVVVTSGNDAGFIFRVTNPSTGADSYNGYYVGISLGQRSVVLGRANGAWTQLAATPNWPGIAAGATIPLRVIASGTHLEVYAGDMTTPAIVFDDPSPLAPVSGAIGVRGYASSFRVDDLLMAALPPVTEVAEVRLETLEGLAPSLPREVQVTRMDGAIERRAVTWDVTGLDYHQSEVAITGTVAGTSLPARAVVVVRPAVLTSTVPADVITEVGVAPVLPPSVAGRFSNGDLRDLPVVRWDAVAPERYASVGQFRVSGVLASGGGVGARANVIVVDPAVVRGPIVAFRAVSVQTVAGVAPQLPTTVVAVHQNGYEENLPVVWDAIDAAQYATAGSAFLVQGTVDGTQLRPSAEVSVTAAEGPAEVAVRLSATSVAQGGTVQVDASGFASGEAVQVWLHSEPRLLATTTADGTGRISVTVRIPAGTPAGAHTVVVSSAAASGSAALQVTAFTLGATGATVGGGIGAAAILLLLGAALLGVRRRRAFTA